MTYLIEKNLNVDKSHRRDKLSVRMITIWYKLLTLVFKLMFSSVLHEVVKSKSKKCRLNSYTKYF